MFFRIIYHFRFTVGLINIILKIFHFNLGRVGQKLHRLDLNLLSHDTTNEPTSKDCCTALNSPSDPIDPVQWTQLIDNRSITTFHLKVTLEMYVQSQMRVQQWSCAGKDYVHCKGLGLSQLQRASSNVNACHRPWLSIIAKWRSSLKCLSLVYNGDRQTPSDLLLLR